MSIDLLWIIFLFTDYGTLIQSCILVNKQCKAILDEPKFWKSWCVFGQFILDKIKLSTLFNLPACLSLARIIALEEKVQEAWMILNKGKLHYHHCFPTEDISAKVFYSWSSKLGVPYITSVYESDTFLHPALGCNGRI